VLDPAAEGGAWTAGVDPGAENPVVDAVVVDGLYLENKDGPAVVDAFVEALAASPIFSVDPAKMSDVVKLRAAQGGDAWAYGYKLVLPLKRPIPL